MEETSPRMVERFEPTFPVLEYEKPPTPNNVNRQVTQPDFEMRQDAHPEGSERTRDPSSSGEREQAMTDLENYYPLHQLYGKQKLDSPHAGKKGHHRTDSAHSMSGVSPLSMEYSMDSTNFGEKSSFTYQSSLLGQHLTEPTRPVQTQKKTLLSTVTHEARSEDIVPTDSEDSTEIVPSDEELFNVGWAKALDPNSGSYYYFTLDRSKIVWDNPLASGTLHTRPSMDTAGSSLLI